jgi:hypothetical protein
MSREHDGHADWNLGHIIYENDPQFEEAIDNGSIVHNFVIAVHGSRKRSHHPSKCLDRHFYTSAKAAWGSEQDAINAECSFGQILHQETQYCSDFHALEFRPLFQAQQ